jgi:hypothetical protein
MRFTEVNYEERKEGTDIFFKASRALCPLIFEEKGKGDRYFFKASRIPSH